MGKVRTGKKPEEPPRGTPAYMLTYGDMTTLMMCFFIFLFNAGKYDTEARIRNAISSFRQSLGVFPSSISVLRPDEVLLVPKERGTKDFFGPEKQLEDLEKRLRKEVEKMQDMGKGYLDVLKQGKEVRVTVGSQALFDSGSASVKEQFRPSLDKIAQFIKDNHLAVVVEGHTDPMPISTAVYPSNWELSSGRASSVVRYLIEKHGIDPALLQAAGYADKRPAFSNETQQGREKNRRIEIVLKPTDKTPGGESTALKAREIFGGDFE
ncbi:MAG TPA: flagellar motor protein MotB [bacterium]|nr:flagellar motor protein MotB [bacterium]